MNSGFWIASVLMCIGALAFVFLPIVLRGKIQRDAELRELQDRERANVLIYKERLRELAGERTSGAISEAEFDALKLELEDGLIDDVDAEEAGSSSQKNEVGGSKLQVGILALLAILTIPGAYLLYGKWGAYEAVVAHQDSSGARKELQQAVELAEAGDTRALLTQLRSKLESSPGAANNIEGWALLARTAMAVQDYSMAAEAYAKLALLEEEPQVKASVYGLLAQAHYYAGRSLDDPLTAAALNQAFALNPDETNSLGLQAIASFQESRFADAVSYWQRVLAIAPNHPAKASIEIGIERAQQLMLESGQGLPSNEPSVASSEASPEATSATVGSEGAPSTDANTVNVRVTVSDSIRANYPADSNVFVFAKAVSGPPLPLAVTKLSLKNLPITLRLDDSLAMRPEFALSKFDRVNVVARISLSGQPIANSGDAEGSFNDVRVGSGELVLIDINTAL
jgi:cytochrome c-type biogenesis protein CcmH